MPNRIARGGSGQATPLPSQSGCHSGTSKRGWDLSTDGFAAFNGNERGWTVSADGTVSVPANAPIKTYTLLVYVAPSSSCPAGSKYETKAYTFEVYEADPCAYEYNASLASGQTTSGTNVVNRPLGASTNYVFSTAAWHKENDTYFWEAHSFNLAINWGDGTTTTTTTNSSIGGFGNAPIPHTYTAEGPYTVTYTLTRIGCFGSKSGSFQVQIYKPTPQTQTRYFCENNKCITREVSDGSGYATLEECQHNCGTTPPVEPPTSGPFVCLPDSYGTYRCMSPVPADYLGPQYATIEECQAACSAPKLYTRYACDAQRGCIAFQTSNPNEGFPDCASANCGPTITYRLWRCQDGVCVPFLSPDPNGGYGTLAQCREECEGETCQCLLSISASDSTNIVFLTVYGADGWDIELTATCNGVEQEAFYVNTQGAQRVYSFQRVFGNWLFNAIASRSGCSSCSATTTLTISGTTDACAFSQGNGQLFHEGDLIRGTSDYMEGWTLIVHHSLGGVMQTPITPTRSLNQWIWNVPALAGQHHFEFAWSKLGCPTHVYDLDMSIGGTTTGGGGTGNCPPCPPPADPVTCKPAVTFVKPDANAHLHNFARIRVQVADPNEQTDPCHHNYNRPCNHEKDGPALELSLGDYTLPVTWKQVSGTPLNGTWETWLDTRDYSNGAHNLVITSRGVGCCRTAPVARNVVLDNTLQGNIFYRDTQAHVGTGLVIPDAVIGIETRALEENTSRRYWLQTAVRSGTALDGPYKHDDWPKHQPVLLAAGESWNAKGARVERHNFSAHVTFRLPLSNTVRVRRKWTPQFNLSAFDLNAERVAKIRSLKAGQHFVFTTNPARVWMYDGKTLSLYGDFSTAPALDAGELSATEHESDFDQNSLDRALSNIYAPDAIDCTVLGGDSTADKVYVVVPPSESAPRGEVFAFDHDSGQLALDYGIRHEARTPRFIEAVGPRVVCLYVHDPLVHIPAASKRTRAYDLTFGAPRLLWQLAETATFTAIDGATLFVACGTKIYSTDGLAAPTLAHDFPSPVTAASSTYVGLQNGQVWQKTSAGWKFSLARTGPIGGVTSWTAGTALQESPGAGEPQTEDARGLCAGEGIWLSGQRQNGSWFDERDLRVPLDLAPKTIDRVTALDHFSVEVPSAGGTDDATTPPQRDERLLIGTAPTALLFVYQRSNLSEKDGALPVSNDTIPRLFPLPRQKTT